MDSRSIEILGTLKYKGIILSDHSSYHAANLLVKCTSILQAGIHCAQWLLFKLQSSALK